MAIGDTSDCTNFVNSNHDYSIEKLDGTFLYTPDPGEMDPQTYGVAYIDPSLLLEGHVVINLGDDNDVWEEMNAIVINYKTLEAGWRLDITNAGDGNYQLLYKDAQGNIHPVYEPGNSDGGSELSSHRRVEVILVKPTVGPHAGKTIWTRYWM